MAPDGDIAEEAVQRFIRRGALAGLLLLLPYAASAAPTKNFTITRPKPGGSLLDLERWFTDRLQDLKSPLTRPGRPRLGPMDDQTPPCLDRNHCPIG